MKISFEIPDVEVRQSFVTMMMYMSSTEDEVNECKAKLNEYLSQGEMTFDINILEKEERSLFKYGVGLILLEKILKERK